VVSLGIFSVVPPTEPCALKVSTRDISWGKGGRCVWLTTYYPCSVETSRNPGPQPTRNPLGHLGLSRYTLLYFTLISNNPSQLQVEFSNQFSVPALLPCYAFPNSFSCPSHRNCVGSYEKPGSWSPLQILIRCKSNSLGRL